MQTEQLYMIGGMMIGMSGVYVVKVLQKMIQTFIMRMKIKTAFQNEMKKLEDFKKEGGMHKWVRDIPIKMPNGEVIRTHACEHTGYCPSIDGFIPKNKIKFHQMEREKELEFEKFQEQEVKNIQERFSLNSDDANEIIRTVRSMERRFSMKIAKDVAEKLKSMFGDNVKIVTNFNNITEDAVGGVEGDESR